MTRFDDVLKIIQGAFVCITDNKRFEFSSKEDFTDSDLYKNYVITSVCSKDNRLVLELQPWQPPVTDMDAKWVKDHTELNGSEPSFF